MKHQLYFAILLVSFSLYSQDEKTNGLFYKISIASTLAINEEYTLVEDDSGALVNLSALFVNNTIGYQMDSRTAIEFNAEYNWQHKQGLHFLPMYMNIRYNIIEDDDNVFIRAGYGKLLKLGNDFERGTLYKLGAGYQIFDDNFRNSWLIGLDFSRKRFGYRETEKITSVGIFLEFMLF